jgi:carotenoid cleavage dioxygenase-like enzyme
MNSVTEAPARTARRGFESLENETHLESLPVRGDLPAWLQGSLLRTGPAKWDVGDSSVNHWFDGLAMLHRFSFGDGQVSYANRYLQSKAYRAAKERGRIGYSEFATDPCRSLFARVTAMFSPKLTDNANVNLVKLGERFFLLRPDSSKPEVVASKPVREPAYMHSFGLTERWLVLAEFPYVVNPLSLAVGGRPYIENYRWKPELGTRFHLFDRATGESAGPFVAEPRFGFHHVNSYDDDGQVVVDVATFADSQIVEDLYLERLRAGKRPSPNRLERFRIAPGFGSVTTERLTDESMELPRINYGRCNERPYRYAWGVGLSPEGAWLDRLVKADVVERGTRIWEERGSFPGEPVFVAAPDAEAEDEGVLLSVVLDGDRGSSCLLVLDARDLSELARAEVPHHIPFGFHGQFARS